MKKKEDFIKITIATPSFNQGQFIEETIKSIVNSGYPNLEYIVMDGGSSDKTVEIIEKYSDKITHWESMHDDGQADALNKALKLATGDVFHWVNSDDILLPNALWLINDNFKPNSLCIFDVINFDDAGLNEQFSNEKFDPTRMVDPTFVCPFHQPGFVFPRWVYCEAGAFDTSLHYSFDWEFVYRATRLDIGSRYVAEPLIRFRHHETSKTSNQMKFVEERTRILSAIGSAAEPRVAANAKALLDIESLSQMSIPHRLFYSFLFLIIQPHYIFSLNVLKRLLSKILH